MVSCIKRIKRFLKTYVSFLSAAKSAREGVWKNAWAGAAHAGIASATICT